MFFQMFFQISKKIPNIFIEKKSTYKKTCIAKPMFFKGQLYCISVCSFFLLEGLYFHHLLDEAHVYIEITVLFFCHFLTLQNRLFISLVGNQVIRLDVFQKRG